MVPSISENHDAFMYVGFKFVLPPGDNPIAVNKYIIIIIVKGQGVQFAMNQGAWVLVRCIVVNSASVLTALKKAHTDTLY
jgi:hypothetical protein